MMGARPPRNVDLKSPVSSPVNRSSDRYVSDIDSRRITVTCYKTCLCLCDTVTSRTT